MGQQKTGTTTIQNVFHAHRAELLAKHGILYPAVSANLTTPLCTMFHDDPRRQHIMVKLMGALSDDQLADLRQRHAHSLEQEIEATVWDTLLLSGEGTYKLNDAELTRLKAWGDRYAPEWTVIVCVRHPVAYVRSIIQQMLKGGDTLDYLYTNPPLPEFQARLTRAQNLFGRENVHVFDFDHAVGHGLIQTFTGLCGIKGPLVEQMTANAAHDNESLSFEAAHILDVLNKMHPLIIDGKRNPQRPDRALAFVARILGRKFDMPTAVQNKVKDLSRPDVLWLNQTFGFDLYPDIIDPTPYALNEANEPTQHSIATFTSMAEIIAERSMAPF